jgi:isochorismate hydrolase
VKETYFTPQDIHLHASQMRSQAEALAHRRGLPFTPAHSALLVLDMQEYFLDPASHAFIPSAAAILPGIRALVRAYRNRRLPVIFTRHVNTLQDAGMMSVWWRERIAPDNPLSRITSNLEVGDSPLILKSQYDAFLYTDLEDRLRQGGVSRVLISGVMAHLCCETTARSAFGRDFEVFYLVDGTATYNQGFHQASLLNLAHGFASLLLTSEALAACEAG